jgi:isochorismate synthase
MFANLSTRPSPTLWVSPLHSDFLLLTPGRSIRASGIFARVSLPAGGSLNGDSLFHGAVMDVFARARRAGVANPLLIGAIPFDQSRPSCLYVPQCHEVFSRDAVLDTLVPAEPPRHRMTGQPLHTPDRATYERGVTHAIAAFRRGEADKVVLSRLCDVTLDRPVEPEWLLQRLVEQNPTGFHFRLPLPGGRTLVGASPELLLCKAGASIRTNPLAGSARRAEHPAEDARIRDTLRASAKDLLEHRYVTESMREVMAPLCDSLDIPDRPSTVSTSTMWHLSTAISGTLKNPDMSALQLACALHPTPALCGYPTQAGHRLIRSIEPFEREMFAGIVGWCDARGDGEWVVAIRCGEIRENRVRMFAGAGIVEGSDPASEWRETSVKLSTMMRALGIEGATE